MCAGTIPMLIYLYGADSYRRAQKLKEIIAAYEKKHSGLTKDVFYLDEKEAFERLTLFLETQSLFGSAKLVVIYSADEAPGSAKLLKTFLEEKTTTIIVISDKKLPKEFAYLLKKPAITQEFEPLETSALYAFIKKEAEERGATLTSDTLRYLSELFGADTWGIVTELEKLALGGRVSTVLHPPAFFPLVQQIKRRGDMRSCLLALGHLLETEDPAAIFNVTASIADPELKIKMADYDIAIKSGKLEYEEALLDLAIS